MKTKSSRLGQATFGEPRVKRVRSNATTLIVDFEDGRTLHLPLAWFPRLFHGTQAQRDRWQLIGPGIGVHWPAVDEDLSAEGLLAGRPSIEYIHRQRKGKKAETVPM